MLFYDDLTHYIRQQEVLLERQLPVLLHIRTVEMELSRRANSLARQVCTLPNTSPNLNLTCIACT